MADISRYIEKINKAKYGEEVRSSISDALTAMNEQASAAQEWATGQDDPTAEPGPTNNAEYWAGQAAGAIGLVENTTEPNYKTRFSVYYPDGFGVLQGFTITRVSDTQITVYGTCTASQNRYAFIFNNFWATKTSASALDALLPAGQYRVLFNYSGYTGTDTNKPRLYWTKSKFSSGTEVSDGDIINSDAPFMFGILMKPGANWGTENERTTINFGLYDISAVDIKARDSVSGATEQDFKTHISRYDYQGATLQGLTITRVSDTQITVYGTVSMSDDVRYLRIFEDSVWGTKTDISQLNAILPAGQYRVLYNCVGYMFTGENLGNEPRLYWTKSTFSNKVEAFDGSIIDSDAPFMLGIRIKNNVVYGTEDNPLTINVGLYKFTAVDEKAREDIGYPLSSRPIITPVSNDAYIDNTEDYTFIKGKEFVGSGDSNKTDEIGFNSESAKRYFTLTDCVFRNFIGNCAVHVGTTNYTQHDGSIIQGCHFLVNAIGFKSSQRGEDVEINGCTFEGNTVGLEIAGGNVNVSNCVINRNMYGIRLIADINDSHGIISNCSFNHCNFGLEVDGISYGETIDSCHFYHSTVKVVNTSGGPVRFNHCVFSGKLILSNNTKVIFTNCWFTGAADLLTSEIDTTTIVGWNNTVDAPEMDTVFNTGMAQIFPQENIIIVDENHFANSKAFVVQDGVFTTINDTARAVFKNIPVIPGKTYHVIRGAGATGFSGAFANAANDTYIQTFDIPVSGEYEVTAPDDAFYMYLTCSKSATQTFFVYEKHVDVNLLPQGYVTKGDNALNVTALWPPVSGYHTLESAIEAIPEQYFTPGMTISFRASGTPPVHYRLQGVSDVTFDGMKYKYYRNPGNWIKTDYDFYDDYLYSVRNRLANPNFKIYEDELAKDESKLRTIVFNGTTQSTVFRIPTVAITNDGTVLAAVENRHGASADKGNFDITLRRTTSNVFGDYVDVMPYDSMTYGRFMDPSFVIDRTGAHGPAGKIWLFAGSFRDSTKLWTQQPTEDCNIVYITSEDDGVTWSSKVSVKSIWDTTKYICAIPAPNSGIQMEDGTLVIPAFCWDGSYSRPMIFYKRTSDEEFVASDPAPNWYKVNIDECSAVEESGKIVLYCRNNTEFASGHHRGEYKFTYDITTDEWVTRRSTFELHDCCQTCVIKTVISGKRIYLMSAIDTNANQRQNTTIWASHDGEHWTRVYRLMTGINRGYSGLAVYGDKIVAIYEATSGALSVYYQDVSWLAQDIVDAAYVYGTNHTTMQDALQKIINVFNAKISALENRVAELEG